MIRPIALILLLGAWLPLCGQTTFVWSYDDIEYIYLIKETPGGNFLIWGESDSVGIERSALASFDAHGQFKWCWNVNPSHPSQDIISFDLAQNGSIWATFANPDVSNDPVLLHLDSTGNLLQARTHPQARWVHANGDGTVLVAGTGNGVPSIAKFNADGSMRWDKQLNTGGNLLQIRSVNELTDGYLITGNRYPSNFFLADAYMVKMDTAGNVLWAQNVATGPYMDYLEDCIPLPDSSFICELHRLDTIATNPITNYHGACRFDAQGNMLWNNLISDLGYRPSLHRDFNGDLLLIDQSTVFLPHMARMDINGNFVEGFVLQPQSPQGFTLTQDGRYAYMVLTIVNGWPQTAIVKVDSFGQDRCDPAVAATMVLDSQTYQFSPFSVNMVQSGGAWQNINVNWTPLTLTDTVLCDTCGVAATFSAIDNGLSWDFQDLSTGNPTQWIWDFGDGQIDTTIVPSVSHNYAFSGNYTVCMTAVEGDCQDSICLPFVVTGFPTPAENGWKVAPNPFSDVLRLLGPEELGVEPMHITVYNPLGQEISVVGDREGNEFILKSETWSPGLYFIRIEQAGKAFHLSAVK